MDRDHIEVGESMAPTGAGFGRDRLTAVQRRWLVVLFLLVSGVASLVAGGHSYAIDNEVQYQTTRSLVQLQPELESVDSIWVEIPVGPYIERDGGGHVAIVGIGHSIVGAPFYLVSRGLAQLLPGEKRDSFVRTGTLFTNSVVLGLLAVAVALLAFQLSRSFRAAWLIGIGYALGTYALPHSKTFFTELTSALALTVAVLTAVRFAGGRPVGNAVVSGFAAGFGVLVRASSAMFVPWIALWIAVVVVRRRGWRPMVRGVAAFGAGGAAPLCAFLFFNWWRFGSPTDVGYSRVPQDFPLEDGLFNHFFTPGKSLFLFAPIIVLGLAGLLVGLFRQRAVSLLVIGVVGANLVFFSRVPYWSGDAAWGARYQQIVLPLMCAPAAILAGRRWWKTAFGTLATIGFVVPALLGSLIYFNVWFVKAERDRVSADAITKEAAWQPFLGQLELLPVGVRDVLDANRPGEIDRGAYSADPSTHYGYFAVEPRVDFWWLWVGPMHSSRATYVYFVPTFFALGGAALLASGRVDSHVAHIVRRRSRSAGNRSLPGASPTHEASLTRGTPFSASGSGNS
jgi:hypothetical protein